MSAVLGQSPIFTKSLKQFIRRQQLPAAFVVLCLMVYFVPFKYTFQLFFFVGGSLDIPLLFFFKVLFHKFHFI